VAGYKIGSEAFFCEDAIDGDGASEDGRLRVGGELELVFGAFKADFGDGKIEALSASSKTARADGYFSASSFPMPGYCDAWPGNTNATLPIVNSSPEASYENARGREFLFDFFIDARARKTGGYANGVFYGLGVRPAMADDTNAAHP